MPVKSERKKTKNTMNYQGKAKRRWSRWETDVPDMKPMEQLPQQHRMSQCYLSALADYYFFLSKPCPCLYVKIIIKRLILLIFIFIFDAVLQHNVRKVNILYEILNKKNKTKQTNSYSFYLFIFFYCFNAIHR